MKNYYVACAAGTSVQFFDVVYEMKMWNFQIYCFNNNKNTQQLIFHSLYSLQWCFYQSICSVLCQQYKGCEEEAIITK